MANDVWWQQQRRMRGVNLGGWLLLERWMQKSVFAGTNALDEYMLCRAWGSEAALRIRRHRETWITHEDFAWLAARGINAVRIPFGYWLLQGDPPLVGGIEFLDQAMQWCEDYGLMALLDLHGLPGGQSPEHHTGFANQFLWHISPQLQEQSLHVTEVLAERYAGYNCLRGIQVINEPDERIPTDILDAYYRESYERIRRHAPFERVAVVVAAFTERRLPDFHGRYRPSQFENIITDVHYYQCFGEWFKTLSLEEHISFPLTQRLPELQHAGHDGWLLIGEWSLRLPWGPPDLTRDLPSATRDIVMRAFAATQLWAYDQTEGWFFWTYKTETEPEWSFRECVRRGWLPDRFDTP